MRHAWLIVMLTALVTAAPAAARQRAPVVWATVNICDTVEHPNKIGIRGSMTGLARRSRMYMRFRVQFRNPAREWEWVSSSTDSGWRRVAIAQRGEYSSGWTVSFMPPASGGAWVLRGVVTFEWRRGGSVVEHARAVTEAGHPGTVGADPADFSATTCEIA